MNAKNNSVGSQGSLKTKGSELILKGLSPKASRALTPDKINNRRKKKIKIKDSIQYAQGNTGTRAHHKTCNKNIDQPLVIKTKMHIPANNHNKFDQRHDKKNWYHHRTRKTPSFLLVKDQPFKKRDNAKNSTKRPIKPDRCMIGFRMRHKLLPYLP